MGRVEELEVNRPSVEYLGPLEDGTETACHIRWLLAEVDEEFVPALSQRGAISQRVEARSLDAAPVYSPAERLEGYIRQTLRENCFIARCDGGVRRHVDLSPTTAKSSARTTQSIYLHLQSGNTRAIPWPGRCQGALRSGVRAAVETCVTIRCRADMEHQRCTHRPADKARLP